MLNLLLILYSFLFRNFGLAIIALTIIIQILMLPVTLKQIRGSVAMSAVRPELEKVKKRYPKDKKRQAEEQANLYQEYGVSPVGCLLPMLIQLPVWIGLFQSVRLALALEGLEALRERLYGWPLIQEAIPVENHFLWLDLANPDPYYILPVLVAVSMLAYQKVMPALGGDTGQTSFMGRWMQYFFPIVFGFWTIYFPSGVAVYFVTTGIVGFAIRYIVTGLGLVPTVAPKRQAAKEEVESPPPIGEPVREIEGPAPSGQATEESPPPTGMPPKSEKRKERGRPRSKRKDRRRSRRTRSR